MTFFFYFSKGYNVAKVFNHKFTHICPVWFRILFEGDKISIDGEQDVDETWMSEVKSFNNIKNPPKIVPRFAFHEW